MKKYRYRVAAVSNRTTAVTFVKYDVYKNKELDYLYVNSAQSDNVAAVHFRDRMR